ncbi:MAG: hypothetical protein FJ291_06575 [Planctomycetes bacterium]|nr:hypothetical protein [Planctomycetota bacterium]
MGGIFNVGFAQIPDAVLGWVGIDYAGDDGRKYGLWPWESPAPAAAGQKRAELTPASPADHRDATPEPPKPPAARLTDAERVP